MHPFSVRDIVFMIRAIEHDLLTTTTSDTVRISEELRDSILKNVDGCIENCEAWYLVHTADQYRRIKQLVNDGGLLKDLMFAFRDLSYRIEDETSRILFLAIDERSQKYAYPEFFDPESETASKVTIQFPSLIYDIAEAGKCLACDRATACVMHLSRVIEGGLKTLAKEIGVATQQNWGNYLREIQTALQNHLKHSGFKSSDEIFYSEALVTFDAIRRAWRNPTMHVDKTYSVAQAEDILYSVRSFMRHLATRVRE